MKEGTSSVDGVRGLMRRVIAHGLQVRGTIESMTGARFVHDTLEELGWDVLIADAANWRRRQLSQLPPIWKVVFWVELGE